MGFLSRLKTVFSRRPAVPTLGLALGSGGAKGMAHLGALKAFEEAGLAFTVITGTSIGSIVGALYAKGFTSADMIGIIENLNKKEFSKNIRPFAEMDFAEKFVEQYIEENIEDLPKKFACWATDAQTNEGVLLNHGKTARALTASSAMPPFFKAVTIDGRRLFDGAFTNAVPADVCKEMGADIVVGIDLSAFVQPDEEKGTISRLLGAAITRFTPVHDLEDHKSRGYDAADVMLRPNLYGHRATDVSRAGMDAMFELGYSEAKARIAEIKEKIAEYPAFVKAKKREEKRMRKHEGE